jgi:hypothetical protein
MRLSTDYWTLEKIGGGASPLYVYLCPPGTATSSIRFTIAGMETDLREGLLRLRPGARVPEEVVEALQALSGYEAWSGRLTGDPQRSTAARRR